MAGTTDDTSNVARSGRSLTSPAQRASRVQRPVQAEAVPPAKTSTAEAKNVPKKFDDTEGLKVIGVLVGITGLIITIAACISYSLHWDSNEVEAASLDKATALRKMLEWMDKGGAYGALPPSAKVEVRDDLGACKCIRGVVAIADIKAEEIIAEIPFNQTLFTVEGQPQPACTSDAQWPVRLASALLREKAKGPASPFYYYIQSLPDEVLAAVSLDDEDLKRVKYEIGRTKLAAQRPWMQTLHRRCSREAPDLIAHASWHEFRWAVAVVLSRSFALKGVRLESAEGATSADRRGDGSGLVPLMDLLNHNAWFNAFWETAPDGRSTQLKAARHISKGEEVCDSYGRRGNDDLLISYGFVIRDNPSEYMALFDTVDAAIGWLFEQFPCRNIQKDGSIGDVVSRQADCREQVMEAVWKGLEDVKLHEIIEGMKADQSGFYTLDIERMGLFQDGDADTRLIAAFNIAFSHPCFLCESLPAVASAKRQITANFVEALEHAKTRVGILSGVVEAKGSLESDTVEGRTDLAIKLRVLEFLEPFGIDVDVDGVAFGRQLTHQNWTGFNDRERVLEEYNESKLTVLLASFYKTFRLT